MPLSGQGRRGVYFYYFFQELLGVVLPGRAHLRRREHARQRRRILSHNYTGFLND